MVNSAYKANFTAANALFFEADLNAKSHKSAQIQFSQHFKQAGSLPITLKEILSKSFEKRQDSDCDFGLAISPTEARELITKAKLFVGAIEKFLQKQAYNKVSFTSKELRFQNNNSFIFFRRLNINSGVHLYGPGFPFLRNFP